jgi:hypothetical protein
MKATVERRLGGGAKRLREMVSKVQQREAPLTHRMRKHLKKKFKKGKQLPSGCTLMYKLQSGIDAVPAPTPRLKSDWAFLDIKAKEMFRKEYDALNMKQKSRLIDSMHKED